MRFRFLPAVLLLFATCSAAKAASITYDVNLAIGGSTATGSITTDGTIGTLSIANITGYTLTINDGTNSATLDPTNSAPIAVDNGDSYFTASDTGLFVNNVAGSNDALSFYLPDFSFGLCFSGEADVCTTNAITGPVFAITANNTDSVENVAGLQEFAAVPGTTPEPSSLLLLGTGAMGIVGAMRRRFV